MAVGGIGVDVLAAVGLGVLGVVVFPRTVAEGAPPGTEDVGAADVALPPGGVVAEALGVEVGAAPGLGVAVPVSAAEVAVACAVGVRVGVGVPPARLTVGEATMASSTALSCRAASMIAGFSGANFASCSVTE